MHFKKNLGSQRGFTLIELVVVIVIMGILTTVTAPRVVEAPSRARDVGRIAGLRDMSLVLKSYFFDKQVFPIPAATTGECLTAASGAGLALVNGKYIGSVDFPKDPSVNTEIGTVSTGATKGLYFYKTVSKDGNTNTAAILVANVENSGQANASLTCIQAKDTYEDMISACIKAAGSSGATTAGDEVYAVIQS